MDNIPQWLITNDNYEPAKDKSTFIDKSILSIFGVVSKLRLQTGYKMSKPNMNTMIKISSALLCILMLALSRSVVFPIIIDVFLFFTISMLSAREIKQIIKVTSSAVIFTAIILLPSIAFGNVYNSVNIVLKVFGMVTTINMLSATTQWNSITSSLKAFYVPDVFIFVMDITIKYIFLLGELALDMLYSLRKKSIGKTKNKEHGLWSIIGIMFIKSKEMSEEMQNAMECRGFVGEYVEYNNYKGVSTWDFIFILIDVIIIVLYFYFGR